MAWRREEEDRGSSEVASITCAAGVTPGERHSEPGAKGLGDEEERT